MAGGQRSWNVPSRRPPWDSPATRPTDAPGGGCSGHTSGRSQGSEPGRVRYEPRTDQGRAGGARSATSGRAGSGPGPGPATKRTGQAAGQAGLRHERTGAGHRAILSHRRFGFVSAGTLPARVAKPGHIVFPGRGDPSVFCSPGATGLAGTSVRKDGSVAPPAEAERGTAGHPKGSCRPASLYLLERSAEQVGRLRASGPDRLPQFGNQAPMVSRRRQAQHGEYAPRSAGDFADPLSLLEAPANGRLPTANVRFHLDQHDRPARGESEVRRRSSARNLGFDRGVPAAMTTLAIPQYPGS